MKLKAQDQIVALPKFEDYTRDSANLDEIDNKYEEFTFRWQEKIFNEQELQYYAESRNCIQDYEIKYNEMINNQHIESSKVFTYINEDNINSLPFDVHNKKHDDNISTLTLCLEGLNINEKLGARSESNRHLFKSEENLINDRALWMSMHVVFDNSKYNEYEFYLLIFL